MKKKRKNKKNRGAGALSTPKELLQICFASVSK